mmetsp:Transcript_14370/g.24469  ORF Transcript_14370/g.24469 Transcript_14370/m.24469 type:complete len:194 (+) Transcript_14370:1377-1958(+)
MLSFLRYAVFDEEEAYLILHKTQCIKQAQMDYVKRYGKLDEKFDQASVFKGRDFSQISIHNETLALKKLLSTCLENLCKYPTSLKQDEQRLSEQAAKLSFTELNCLQLVMGEKRILHKLIDTANLLLPLFDAKMTLKRARELISSNSDFDANLTYCDIVVFPLLKEREGLGQTKEINQQINQKLNQSKPQRYV